MNIATAVPKFRRMARILSRFTEILHVSLYITMSSPKLLDAV